MNDMGQDAIDELWEQTHTALHVMRSFASHLMEQSARLENAMVDFAPWYQELCGPQDEGGANVVPFPTED